MANYPQLDNASGVWNLREVYDAVMGGYWPNYNSIALVSGFDSSTISVDKATISTTGSSSVFGDLSVGRAQLGAAASITRGLFFGGYTGSTLQDEIDYATFTTTGNFADFGNLTSARRLTISASNSVRAVTMGGYTSSGSNVVDYVTINSTGDATDFGDTAVTSFVCGSGSSPTRGFKVGGGTPSLSLIHI